MSTSFFVAADWLAEHIDDPEIQIIDARMAPPGQEERDLNAEYQAGHIPGAVFFDIEALSDHTSPLPHMMPRAEAFAVAMRELGVSSDKHLVVYDEGNLFSAPRAGGCCARSALKRCRLSPVGWRAGAAMGYRWSRASPNCRKVILTAASIRWRSSA